MRFAPLCILSFRVIQTKKISEAYSLHRKYRRYADIENVPDRLRWRRHELGLLQKEAAVQIGVSRSVYHSLETGEAGSYDPAVMDKLSALYGIPVSDLLDDYHRFLLNGQGQAIRALRASLNMTRAQFADHLRTDVRNIRAWETEQKTISKRMWEVSFKDFDKFIEKSLHQTSKRSIIR